MRIADTFDPLSATSGSFSASFPNGVGKMLIINESNVNLILTFQDGSQAYSPAGDRRLFCVHSAGTTVNWQQQSILGGQTPLVSQVVVEVYDPGEKIVETYPSPLVRQTNIGNSIPVSTSTDSIVNTGNPAGTAVITATQLNALLPNIDWDNDGNLTVREGTTSQSVLLQLITGVTNNSVTLGQVGKNVTIPGSLFCSMYGKSTFGDIIDASSNDTYLKGQSSIRFQVPNGTTRISIDSGGMNFGPGSIIAINTGTVTTSGSVTVNHGLGGTPTAVLAVASSGSSTATVGCHTYTSTQFTLQNGGGFSVTFRWWAYR